MASCDLSSDMKSGCFFTVFPCFSPSPERVTVSNCGFSIRNNKKHPPESTRTLLPLNLSLRSGITTSCRHVGTFPQECTVPSISRGSSFFSEPDTASVPPFPPVLLEAPIPDLATRGEPKLVELRGTPETTVA